MRPESEALWKQGLEDLKTAKVLLEAGRYYASVFFSHQAAEKFLKAAYIELKRELYPKTHNLVELGKALGMEDLMENLMELNPEYSVTRYPDAANGIPAEMYNENIARKHIRTAERVMEVCRRLMRSSEQ
ncbi:MAG: HEPN domain-containing protein [Candidatus Korarchaeota archaeon]|nr:HEPN domain-containing protein [Candidatus Korarchaeota archaeon]